MIEVVWDIRVREDAQRQFALVYGPGGAWSTLFGASPGFRGTTVLNDIHDPRRYLIIDLWDTEAQRDQALIERADEYAKLRADLQDRVEAWLEVGVFRVRSEATIRPRAKPSRRKPRSSW